jgi:hypothetical protein
MVETEISRFEDITTNDVRVYKGEVKKGTRIKHGRGTYTIPSKSNYVGQWKDNKRHGQGMQMWKNGNQYFGGWQDGKKNGEGTFVWKNRNKYKGEWLNGKKHGQGTFFWVDNGNKYEGGWRNDQKHGYGTKTNADGTGYTGHWKDGINIDKKKWHVPIPSMPSTPPPPPPLSPTTTTTTTTKTTKVETIEDDEKGQLLATNRVNSKLKTSSVRFKPIITHDDDKDIKNEKQANLSPRSIIDDSKKKKKYILEEATIAKKKMQPTNKSTEAAEYEKNVIKQKVVHQSEEMIQDNATPRKMKAEIDLNEFQTDVEYGYIDSDRLEFQSGDPTPYRNEGGYGDIDGERLKGNHNPNLFADEYGDIDSDRLESQSVGSNPNRSVGEYDDNGEITNNKPRSSSELSRRKYDAFLSHNWGMDKSNRCNHGRVVAFNNQLRKAGIRHTWIDEERMTGNVEQKMCDGINNSRFVIIFVTSEYIQKVMSTVRDNCRLEFEYATRMKRIDELIVVVMENECSNPGSWEGPVGMHLGGQLYYSYKRNAELKMCARDVAKVIKERMHIITEENLEATLTEAKRLLAARSPHLPGYGLCKDWSQWMRNNHPLFGLCCSYTENPIDMGTRIMSLIVSLANGLSVTNFIYVYFSVVWPEMENIELGKSFKMIVPIEWTVILTLGSALHAAVDLTIWQLAGGFNSRRSFGRLLIYCAWTTCIALAIVSIIHRAYRYKDDDESMISISFVFGYPMELFSSQLIYFPFFATMFLFWCRCWCCGRQREIERQEKREDYKQFEIIAMMDDIAIK